MTNAAAASSASSSSEADRFASRHPFHLIVLGTFLYATGPVIARSSTTSGVLLAFWRLWFGAGLLALASLWLWRTGRALGTRRGLALGVLAGLFFSGNQMLFFSAVQRVSVVDATLMTTLSPILVAALAVPLFGERPGPGFRTWSGVAMVGAFVVVAGSSNGPSGDLVGMAMAFGAACFFAGFFVVSKLGRDDAPVVTFLTASMTTAAVVVTVFVFATGSHPATVVAADRWRALAVAVVPGTLGHAVMTWPLRYVPANVPPLVRLTGPVLSGLMAWVFLGEGVAATHLIGGAIIIVGLAGALRSREGRALIAKAKASAQT